MARLRRGRALAALDRDVPATAAMKAALHFHAASLSTVESGVRRTVSPGRADVQENSDRQPG